MRRITPLLMCSALLAGCESSPPQNALEFREWARKSPANVDSFEVSRPLADVASVLRQQSAQCLNVKVRLMRRHGSGPAKHARLVTYKTTFVSRDNNAELDVQGKTKGRNQTEAKTAPPDGPFLVVMDATAVSANRTKVDIYRRSSEGADDAIRAAVAHWVNGDNLDCPVLAAR